MATFRSRQRANQRRDVKREPRSARPEEGKTPVDPASRARPDATKRPDAPRSNTPRTDSKRPDTRPKTPGSRDTTARAQSERKPSGPPRSENPPRHGAAKPFDKPFNKPRAPESRPVEPEAPALTPPLAAPRRRFITPASEAPEPAARQPEAPREFIPAPAAAPAQQVPSSPTTPRRRLITPASEAPEPAQHQPEPARAFSPSPTMEIESEAPVAPSTPAIPTGPRRRLITPASEVVARPAPTETDSAPKVQEQEAEPERPVRAGRIIQPNPHAPVQRRGLPTNERLPTERPAFERRSAEARVRHDAPELGLALFTSCPRGLEPVLQQELQRMGASEIAVVDGGVSCNGAPDLMMRINLESRVASRVLLRLAQGQYQSERDVNALAMQIDWPRHFDVTRTIKVKTDGVGAKVKSLDFVSLTVKDAICDRFRQAQLGRPNVDTRAPDARIQVFLSPNQATIYLDSSGEPLFKRGWRKETGEAPLRENLAAGILLLAGYNGEQALIDPMCGSGTFLVEAAEIALNRAPGRSRDFAFQKWRSFDPALWQQLKQAAAQAEKAPQALAIQGSDNDGKMIAIARANLERANLQHLITLETKDLFDVRPNAENGLIVTNPPYGVRMEQQETLEALYPLIGDWLKQHFAGWTANLFSGDMNLAKLIRLSVKRRIPLYNGSLDCRVFVLRIIAGSAREEKV